MQFFTSSSLLKRSFASRSRIFRSTFCISTLASFIIFSSISGSLIISESKAISSSSCFISSSQNCFWLMSDITFWAMNLSSQKFDAVVFFWSLRIVFLMASRSKMLLQILKSNFQIFDILMIYIFDVIRLCHLLLTFFLFLSWFGRPLF